MSVRAAGRRERFVQLDPPVERQAFRAADQEELRTDVLEWLARMDDAIGRRAAAELDRRSAVAGRRRRAELQAARVERWMARRMRVRMLWSRVPWLELSVFVIAAAAGVLVAWGVSS